MNFFLSNSSFLEPLNFWPKCVSMWLLLSLSLSHSLVWLSMENFLPLHLNICTLTLHVFLCLLFCRYSEFWFEWITFFRAILDLQLVEIHHPFSNFKSQISKLGVQRQNFFLQTMLSDLSSHFTIEGINKCR